MPECAAAVSWAWSVATVLASLAAGASVVCTPGFDVNSFFAMADRSFSRRGTPRCPPCIKQFSPRPGTIASERRTIGCASSAPRRLRCRPASSRNWSRLSRPPSSSLRDDGNRRRRRSHAIRCRRAGASSGSGRRPSGLDVAIMDEGGALLPGGADGPDRRPGRERHGGLRRQPDGDRRRVCRRLVQDRRSGFLR